MVSPGASTSGTTGGGAEGPSPHPMLIDHHLPRFDVTAIEHLVIDAPLDATWSALQELDLMQVHSPLMDAAFYVRGLPERLAGRSGRARSSSPPPSELKLSGVGSALDGWLSLGQDPPREVAFGAIGRFWQPEIEWYDVTAMTPEEFRAFAEPGWGRIAANFSLRHYGEMRTLASYEARTATPDAATARKFGRYWTLVRPFVGHILGAALNTLREDAVRGHGGDR
jgi:hypothetical protein